MERLKRCGEIIHLRQGYDKGSGRRLEARLLRVYLIALHNTLDTDSISLYKLKPVK